MKWTELLLVGFLVLSFVLVGITVVESLAESSEVGDTQIAQTSRPSSFAVQTPRPTEPPPTLGSGQSTEFQSGRNDEGSAPLAPTPTERDLEGRDPTPDS